MRVFREVTVAQTVLNDPATASHEIERVLAAADRSKRPVYIEIPRDCAHLAVTTALTPSPPPNLPADPATLAEALEEALAMLNAASNPVLLLGVEIHRFGLQDRLIQFIGKSGICFAQP